MAASTRDFSAELNPQQTAAATHGDGPLLIIAGAGTGKTRTLVY
ncbi:MAG TPA: UvrD-helicase domain-containing protein, partial [Gemmatimonadaceae bacterium]|nr:UvrD-helicase domain-containing protein [Gemmatimonadaceae bacterium]